MFIDAKIDRQKLDSLIRWLEKPQDRLPEIILAGGMEAAKLLRNWIRNLADTRHGTAERLGASPTNHFKASDVSAPVVADGSATISITTPGISRAYGPVRILPVEAHALAIPLHADAYGIQPRELTDRGETLFRMLRRGERRGGERTNVLYRSGEDGRPVAMYALVGAVTQPQDRSLLPSDEDMAGAFAAGAERAVKAILDGA